jgi:NAD(P)-dependent dehydrogenase (short-subunit alcohol dehydrogenase family)
VQGGYDGLDYDVNKHSVAILPLELSDLRTVKRFAAQVLDTLGSKTIDVLLLNAAVNKSANEAGINGTKFNEQYIVNHLSQHYLIQLLREKLIPSKSRIVVVSSGAVRGVTDPSTLDNIVKAQSGADFMELYAATKFTQLLGAHWWRQQLQGQCQVVAVSPGVYLRIIQLDQENVNRFPL